MSIYTDSYDRGLQDALEGRERAERESSLGWDRRGYEHGYQDGLERRAAGEQPEPRKPAWLHRAAGKDLTGAVLA